MAPWLLDALGLPSSGSGVEWCIAACLAVLASLAGLLAWRVRARRSDALSSALVAALLGVGSLAFVLKLVRGELLLGETGLRIPTYGFLIASGAALAIWLSYRDVERNPRGLTGVELLDLYFWLIVGGIGGARALYVLTVPGPFLDRCVDGVAGRGRDCLAAFRFWEGGLVFWGGVIGCVAVLVLWCRRHGHEVLATIDRIVPWGPFGHALGRIGCIGAGCCFGGLCENPARAIVYPVGSPAWEMQRADGGPDVVAWTDAHGHAMPVWPVQLWEAAGELVIFALLVFWLRPRTRGDGWLLGWWMVLYSTLRFTLELYRGDGTRGFVTELRLESVNVWLGVAPDAITLLSTSQALSLLGGIAGVALLVFVDRRTRAPLPDPAARRPRGGRASR